MKSRKYYDIIMNKSLFPDKGRFLLAALENMFINVFFSKLLDCYCSWNLIIPVKQVKSHSFYTIWHQEQRAIAIRYLDMPFLQKIFCKIRF